MIFFDVLNFKIIQIYDLNNFLCKKHLPLNCFNYIKKNILKEDINQLMIKH